MMTAEQAPAPVEVPVIRTTGAAYGQLSDDGAWAKVIFHADAQSSFGPRAGVEFPPGGLGRLGSIVNQLDRMARRRAVDPGQASVTKVITVQAGTTPAARGSVLVLVDQGLPTEQILLIPDKAMAWELAKVLRQSVLEVSSADERVRLLANGSGDPGLAVPTRRLILPGEF